VASRSHLVTANSHLTGLLPSRRSLSSYALVIRLYVLTLLIIQRTVAPVPEVRTRAPVVVENTHGNAQRERDPTDTLFEQEGFQVMPGYGQTMASCQQTWCSPRS
jgi:hypothetical protein